MGSEMCIRDSPRGLQTRRPRTLPLLQFRRCHVRNTTFGKINSDVETSLTGEVSLTAHHIQKKSTSYELVKAFMGPFKAGFYQEFAALFGTSLKKEYDPEGEDKLTERVVLLVENGQI